ncbi:hypothetical protein ES702_02098 [subsurface metagenome]
MVEALIDDEIKLNKERLKILYGAKPAKKISISKKPSKKISKPKKIKEQKISKTINLSSNYYKMDNNVSDFLNPTQTSTEQAVYNRLYRLAIGYQKNICRIGMGALARSINIKSSQKTIKKAIEGLIQKGHIKRFDTNKRGTLYQIFLPHEIKGIKNTIVNSTIVKNTIVNSTTSTVVKNTTQCSKKYYSQPIFSDNKKIPKDNLKTTYKDNNRDVVVNFFNKRFETYQGTLSIETVKKISENHNIDKILTYINRIPNDNSIRNPAGLLYKALNNNWELTLTKEEMLEKKRLHREREFKTQQGKERIERMKFEKAKAEEERLNKVFAILPKKQQKDLKAKAINVLKQEYLNISPRAFDFIIATKTMIMIKMREMLKKKLKVSKIEKEMAKETEKTFGIPVKIGA